jgi:hypothetical protein
MSKQHKSGEHRLRQIPIPDKQLKAGVYSPANELVPWGMIATLHPRARALAKHAGLHFEDSFDEVDALQIALIEISGGRRVALVDHVDAPVPATEVHANVTDTQAADELLHEVLAALNLDETEVAWRQPLSV